MPDLYAQLHDRVLPHLEQYHNDLLVHDRQAIADWPGVPFLHWTRACGTHLLLLPPADSHLFPPPGLEVPYLFGHAGREHLLSQVTVIAEYPVHNDHTRACFHCDGTRLQPIPIHHALTIARQYVARICDEWSRMPARTFTHTYQPLRELLAA